MSTDISEPEMPEETSLGVWKEPGLTGSSSLNRVGRLLGTGAFGGFRDILLSC